MACGLLDASANRGPSTSGIRMNSSDGGRSPWALAVTTTDPVDTDHEIVTGALGWNPVPVTVTTVPGGPTAGLRTSVGVPPTCLPGGVEET